MDKGNNSDVTEQDNQKPRVCKRCKHTYTASSNALTSCRFHPSFFVCRRHDDQQRCLVDVMVCQNAVITVRTAVPEQ